LIGTCAMKYEKIQLLLSTNFASKKVSLGVSKGA